MTATRTLAYRSPDVLVDGRRWHLAVRGRTLIYRWHDGPRGWRPLTQWVGRPPKGLGRIFIAYRRHADIARARFTVDNPHHCG